MSSEPAYHVAQIGDLECVSEILSKHFEAPISSAWTIIDSYENLRLVFFDKTKDNHKDFLHLKGLIVDLATKKIVPCQGDIPLIISNMIGHIDGKIILLRENDTPITLNAEDSVINRGYEGMIVRIFKLNGKVFFSTFRKICPDGPLHNRMTIREMYNLLGGPDPETLFDKNQSDSDHCHMFMVSHRDLWLATKNPDKGGVFYISSARILNSNVGDASMNPVECPVLSVEEANEFLDHGYHPALPAATGPVFPNTPESMPHSNPQHNFVGEFVVVKHKDSNNDIKFYRVESPGYTWRKSIVGDNQDFYTQLFGRIEDAAFKKSQTFPLVVINNFNRLPVIYAEIGGDSLNRRDNCRNCFFISVPLHRQRGVLDMIHQHDDHDYKVAFQAILDHKKYQDASLPKQVRERVSFLAKKTRDAGFYRDRKLALASLLENEYPDSLTRIIKWSQGRYTLNTDKEVINACHDKPLQTATKESDDDIKYGNRKLMKKIPK